ncbi:MAG: DUF4340 domain-containing protein [Saprospiraceae bacterium]|nr:DUF4340 domain-containing protein [Saprospiraceae bacterium]
MNNKTLFFIFLGLLAIYGLSQVFTGKRTSNFDTELIQVDTSQVSRIIVKTKPPASEEITLQREGDGWIASSGSVNTKATGTAIQALLSNIRLIQTKYIASNSEEKWADYEVGEGQGTRIQVFAGETLLEDFISGRFAFDQQAQTGTSYIRLSSGKEVYAVDGFQTLTLGQGFNSYRNRMLTNTPPNADFAEVTIQKEDDSLTLSKGPSGWMFEDQLLDSMKVENYVQQFTNLRGETFADDFDELAAANYRFGQVSLKGPQLPEGFSIAIYRDTTRINPFVFQSSQNPETWFDSDSTGLFQQLVKGIVDFLPPTE